LFAPAKINYGLRILGIRSDGYHLLDSVFLPLDVGDEVEVEAAARGVSIQLSGLAAGVPDGPENLAAKAAQAFLKEAGLGSAVAIRLGKGVPAAAGLGGGSSDAGAVLRLLAERHPGRVAPERLAELALELGADVPFFLDPRPARVGGIGERITPLAGVRSLAVLLANPGISLATAEVYRARDALGAALTPDPAGSTMPPPRALSESEGRIDELDPGALAAEIANDLEPAARRLCPPIGRLCERLREAGALAVGLSGSGPTLFGIFPDRAAAERAEAACGFETPVWSRVAETYRSP
jgi:4-diphosphocytidyl-2-C-methyl-D-erythritol kinase